MALESCPECDSEISTDAEECPQCGADVRHGCVKAGETMQSCGCILTLLITIPLLLILFFGCKSMAERMDATPSDRLQYVEEYGPMLSEQVKEAILQGRVVEGMTHDQVIAALGKYQDYNESVIAGEKRLQLIYRGSTGYPQAYVYLEEDSYGYMSVTGWQNVCKIDRFCVSAPSQ